jgi:hypothetical protein
MRQILMVLMVIFLATPTLKAQTSGLPFCQGVSRDSMVTLVREDKVHTQCNVTESQMREALNRRLARAAGGVVIRTRAEHADYIGSLERHECREVAGTRTFEMSWVTNTTPRQVQDGRWNRGCRSGEVMLCDRNLNFCPYSETCWNTVWGTLSIPPSRQADGPRRDPSTVHHTHSGTVNLVVSGNVTAQETPSRRERKRPIFVLRRDWPYPVVAGVIIGAVVCANSETRCGMVRVRQETNVGMNAAIVAEPRGLSFGLNFTP